MAEAARRMGNGLGADVARRLIARPIRLQRPPTTNAASTGTRPTDSTAAPIVPDLTRRLEADITLLKAVLKAERDENAKLRLAVLTDEEPLGDEARAVRDRWAHLVDRLLTGPR